MKITIELDHEDFEQLGTNSMRWAGDVDWQEQTGRFRVLRGGDITWDYRHAHWFSDAASVILARAYLTEMREAYQVLTDEVDGQYVIVTPTTRTTSPPDLRSARCRIRAVRRPPGLTNPYREENTMSVEEFTPDQLLANETEQVFRQFMYMPNDHCFTVSTLWVLHTHLRSAEGVFLPYVTPRLYYGSKIAGCGKSLATEITTRMSHNGEMVLEPTPPSVTTMMNQDQSTLGFDEIDTYFGRGNGKNSMRAILNGGYKRGSFVTRQRADESERQNCHGPIVMNGKNAARFMTSENFDTLRTRSICVILDQKPHGYYVDRFNPELHDGRLRDLMKRLRRWGLINARGITSIPIDGLMPERIANRAEEIWTVLFRIAEHLGGDWPARCDAAARAFVLGEWEADITPTISPAEELLYCVRAIVRDNETFVPTSVILERLEELPQRASMMTEWHSERAATMGLSRALAVRGIVHIRRTYEGDQVWGYDSADLDHDCQPSQPANLVDQPTLF